MDEAQQLDQLETRAQILGEIIYGVLAASGDLEDGDLAEALLYFSSRTSLYE